MEKCETRAAKLYLEMKTPITEFKDGFFGDVKLRKHLLMPDAVEDLSLVRL